MNRNELIDMIADKAELTKAAAERALSAFIDGLTGSLKKGDPVVLVNFGTWTVKKRAARKGRNPRTGEPMTYPACKVPTFKPGKALKDAVK